MKNKKAASKPKAKEKNNTLGLLVLLLLASGTFATVSLLKNGTGMFTKAASKNKPPVFCTDLTVVPQTGSAPLEVSATVSGTSKGGDKIYSYAFDFGDGTSLVKSSTPTQTHLYEKPGNFVAKGYVMAKISGQVGGTDKCAKNITVNAGTISLDRTSVTETLDVANADVNSGLIFGNGFNITSEGATGFQIKDISND